MKLLSLDYYTICVGSDTSLWLIENKPGWKIMLKRIWVGYNLTRTV